MARQYIFLYGIITTKAAIIIIIYMLTLKRQKHVRKLLAVIRVKTKQTGTAVIVLVNVPVSGAGALLQALIPAVLAALQRVIMPHLLQNAVLAPVGIPALKNVIPLAKKLLAVIRVKTKQTGTAVIVLVNVPVSGAGALLRALIPAVLAALQMVIMLPLLQNAVLALFGILALKNAAVVALHRTVIPVMILTYTGTIHAVLERVKKKSVGQAAILEIIIVM